MGMSSSNKLFVPAPTSDQYRATLVFWPYYGLSDHHRSGRLTMCTGYPYRAAVLL